jgi:hypothetical protein
MSMRPKILMSFNSVLAEACSAAYGSVRLAGLVVATCPVEAHRAKSEAEGKDQRVRIDEA